MGIHPSTLAHLKGIMPYAWTDHNIPYLGLKLTFPTSALVSSNLKPLLDSISEDTQKLRTVELSWAGRIAAFKIVCLFKILYVFRTLSAYIPLQYLTALYKLLRAFIWQKKRARCNYAHIIKHKTEDGLGLLDIPDYYFASQLAPLCQWFSQPPAFPWLTIESTLSESEDLSLQLLADLWRPLNIQSFAITTQASLKAWRMLVKQLDMLSPDTLIVFPIENPGNLTTVHFSHQTHIGRHSLDRPIIPSRLPKELYCTSS